MDVISLRGVPSQHLECCVAGCKRMGIAREHIRALRGQEENAQGCVIEMGSGQC